MLTRKISTLGALIVGLAVSSGVAAAEEHVVTASVTQYQPAIIFIKPGDSVRWDNMAGHDTASIPGMIPDGAAEWHSSMGENYSHTFDKEGVYVYKCTPHVSTGMLGAVVVGEGRPANLDAVLNHPENKGMIGRTVRNLKKELAAKGIE